MAICSHILAFHNVGDDGGTGQCVCSAVWIAVLGGWGVDDVMRLAANLEERGWGVHAQRVDCVGSEVSMHDCGKEWSVQTTRGDTTEPTGAYHPR